MKIIVADECLVVREGLSYYLDKQPGFKVVTDAVDCVETIKKVSVYQPEVLILDSSILREYTEDVISELKKQYPELIIIIYTTFMNEGMIYQFLRAGANSYISKSLHPKHIIKAILSIFDGGIWIDSPTVSRKFKEVVGKRHLIDFGSPLTMRQKEVLKLVADGLSNKQIGIILGIKERTVKQHLYNIVVKLQAHNRVEAAMIAKRMGIL